MWRAEDNFLELVLSSHHVATGIPTRAVRLGDTSPVLLSPLLSSLPMLTYRKEKVYSILHNNSFLCNGVGKKKGDRKIGPWAFSASTGSQDIQ